MILSHKSVDDKFQLVILIGMMKNFSSFINRQTLICLQFV